MLAKKNVIEKEVQISKILPEIASFYRLSKKLGLPVSLSLSKELKIQLYITLLWPIITYETEIWSLRKMKKRKLILLERKKTNKKCLKQ